MAKSEQQKGKLLVLKDLLERKSDCDHPLSMQDILSHLEARGIAAERKSIYSDLETLREQGMDILYRQGRGGGYYLAARDFELPELKLLVDAVQSSRFLTEKKSLELIAKLERLVSVHEAGQLRRQVVVSGRIKTMNESIYYTVDRIHEAIGRNSTITFRYFDWGMDGEKHFRPRLYEASPYALCWADENYYLIAHSDRHGITHYRVDKMAELTCTGHPRVMTDEGRSLDLGAYSKAVFSMFHGQRTTVRMRFHRSLAGVVIDRFGLDTIRVPDGPDHFTVTAEISVSPTFLGWFISFGSRAEILYPPAVRQQMADLLTETLACYQNE